MRWPGQTQLSSTLVEYIKEGDVVLENTDYYIVNRVFVNGDLKKDNYLDIPFEGIKDISTTYKFEVFRVKKSNLVIDASIGPKVIGPYGVDIRLNKVTNL